MKTIATTRQINSMLVEDGKRMVSWREQLTLGIDMMELGSGVTTAVLPTEVPRPVYMCLMLVFSAKGLRYTLHHDVAAQMRDLRMAYRSYYEQTKLERVAS